jgi:hypothetical protein
MVLTCDIHPQETERSKGEGMLSGDILNILMDERRIR